MSWNENKVGFYGWDDWDLRSFRPGESVCLVLISGREEPLRKLTPHRQTYRSLGGIEERMRLRTYFFLLLTAISMNVFGQVIARPAPGANLLLRKIVQDDLKLSPDVRSKIESAYQKQMTAAGGERGADGSVRFMGGSMEAMQSANQKFEKEAMALLNKGQQTRLGELKIQSAGGRALLEAEVQNKLDLSGEQIAKIKAIDGKRNDAIQDEARGAGGQFGPDFIAKIRALSEKYDGQMEDVLTKSQGEAFEKMKGKPLAGLRSGPRIANRGG